MSKFEDEIKAGQAAIAKDQASGKFDSLVLQGQSAQKADNINPPANDLGMNKETKEPNEVAADMLKDLGGKVGSVVGGTAGSVLGPAGTLLGGALGGAIGSSVGGAAKNVLNPQVPSGPGKSIESGQVGAGGATGGDAAMSIGMSLQKVAMQGLKNKASAKGEGKVF